MNGLRGLELLNYDYQDYLHVQYPQTHTYFTSRFLRSHCSLQMIDFLSLNRAISKINSSNLIRGIARDNEPSLVSICANLIRAFPQLHCQQATQNTAVYLLGLGRKQLADTLDLFLTGQTEIAEAYTRIGLNPKVEEDPNLQIIRAIRTVDRLAAAEKRIPLFGAGEHTEFLLERSALI